MTLPLRSVHSSASHGRRAAQRQLDPGRAPLRLDWDRSRWADDRKPGRHRVRVPLLGGPLPVGASQLLTQLLEVQWVFDPVSDWSMGCAFARVSQAREQGIQDLTVDLVPRDAASARDEALTHAKLRAVISQVERIYDADDCVLAAGVFSPLWWPQAVRRGR